MHKNNTPNKYIVQQNATKVELKFKTILNVPGGD
jgi:hypothetical protein